MIEKRQNARDRALASLARLTYRFPISFLVVAARHRLDAHGLVTTLRVSGPEGGGGGLPGGVL